MVRFLVGVFVVLHGLVHLLYLGQNQRLFELQPGMVWPDGSWALSRLLGDGSTRMLASVLLVLAGIGFAASGAGMLARQAWWRPAVVSVATFSSVIYLLLWNGTFRHLDNQGWIGILINAAILVAVLVFEWPNIGAVSR
jgi:hypothetical protein